jgi:hypothetical protein
MNTLLIRRYRRSGGTRGSSQMGFPVVLLTTRGQRPPPAAVGPAAHDRVLAASSAIGAPLIARAVLRARLSARGRRDRAPGRDQLA